jgi:hypothetical protein
MEPTAAGNTDLRSLVKAYLLGERIHDAAFRFAVLEGSLELYKELGRYPGLVLVKFAYEKSRPGSGIRKFLVQVYMLAGSAKWLGRSDDVDKMPAEFLRDLTQALLRGRQKDKGWDVEAAKREICPEEQNKDGEQQARKTDYGSSLGNVDEEL